MIQKKVPMRKCIGCMESKPKKELIRIVAGPEGVAADLTGRANGRGAYICPDKACLEKAFKKNAIFRNLAVQINDEQKQALTEVISGLDKENKN